MNGDRDEAKETVKRCKTGRPKQLSPKSSVPKHLNNLYRETGAQLDIPIVVSTISTASEARMIPITRTRMAALGGP